MRKVTATLLALTLLLAGCGAAWRPIGTSGVARGMDREVIRVADWRDRMRAIRIDVDRGAVTFREIQVRYGNGTLETLERGMTLRAGHAVVFNLPGRVRTVEQVILIYASVGIDRGIVTVSAR